MFLLLRRTMMAQYRERFILKWIELLINVRDQAIKEEKKYYKKGMYPEEGSPWENWKKSKCCRLLKPALFLLKKVLSDKDMALSNRVKKVIVYREYIQEEKKYIDITGESFEEENE